MSSIHYKFRATLEYKTLQFDGLHITGADLKKEICAKEGIRAEAFDLLLQNAHTKRSYTAEELIPRNSSIIVQRVPREDAEKLPKIQGVNTGAIASRPTAETGLTAPAPINPEEFEKLSEEDQIAHIKDVSTAKYHSSNFQKKTTNIMSGPPPPTYTCNRCNQPGHWYKNCPMLATKRTTGIPSQELMETTAEDPLAMLHPSGKLVVPIMHWKARQHTKKVVEEGPAIERVPPPELTCPICSHLLKDAVLTTCCGNSFCADCASNKIMESPDRQCPGKNCDHKQLSLDSLVPNKSVRRAAAAWSMGGSGGQEEHMRFRIGLQPSAPISAASTPPQTMSPAVSQSTIAPAPTVTVPSQDPAVQAQNSPTPFPSQPATVSVPVPASFSQPPPNMAPAVPVVASSSSSGDALLPPGTSVLPPQTITLPLTTMQTANSLPPIPGVGLPLQQQLLVPANSSYMYNQPPPTMTLGAPQPQIMDAWDAFLHRKDRERERPRKRARSRNRSTSSTSSSSSAEDRRKRHSRHDRDKRRVHRSDKEKEHRGRENRYRNHGEDRRDRERNDRDRIREREYSDRHRDSRAQRSTHVSRREVKEELALPSLMGLEVATPPNLLSKRERSRSPSASPREQIASSSDRKKRKKDSRFKSDAKWRSRKEKEQRKGNDSEEVAKEIADEEAIDGTLREVAEFVRVEANCDDDGIEFDVEETEVAKETVTEAEDEKSVTDTEPVPEEQHAAEPAENAIEQLSEADNEEPLEPKSESDALDRKSESDATLVTKEDIEEKDTLEEHVEEDEERSTRKKDKKHKKHKKHKRSREAEDEGGSESKHRHKRKKEKKEKKEKRKKDKKHKRDKEEASDHREDLGREAISRSRDEDEDRRYQEAREETVVEKDVKRENRDDIKDERRESESSNYKKKEEHKSRVYEDREEKKHDDRKHDDKRYEKSRGEAHESRKRDKSQERSEKHRHRSRERSERKHREHSSKKKERDSSRERNTEERRQDTERKEDVLSKEKLEKSKPSQPQKGGSGSSRQENVASEAVRRQPSSQSNMPSSSSVGRGGDNQSKTNVDPSILARKHKDVAAVRDRDEPQLKKQKQESSIPTSASSTASKLKPAAPIIKFKVNPPSLKRPLPLLKSAPLGDKDSTDVEEDKAKLTGDANTGTDRRMREAFSPPKLQRKKITLNL
ncbi:unnamed protein product [Cylicocyclus nassatus]|uniref:E3 ubiquitin-protein ligase RBBP6 n=1 Tax=Cylicocyclus nassatus TaxID=53992 RepID=A0AA36DT13_CYLNA|nr:unnamed protein product [Cylicocyclus nassatus]